MASFFDLPVELRVQIYALLLVQQNVIVPYFWSYDAQVDKSLYQRHKFSKTINLALLRVSRGVRLEALEGFCGKNEFFFAVEVPTPRKSTTIPPPFFSNNKALFRHIAVHLNTLDNETKKFKAGHLANDVYLKPPSTWRVFDYSTPTIEEVCWWNRQTAHMRTLPVYHRWTQKLAIVRSMSLKTLTVNLYNCLVYNVDFTLNALAEVAMLDTALLLPYAKNNQSVSEFQKLAGSDELISHLGRTPALAMSNPKSPLPNATSSQIDMSTKFQETMVIIKGLERQAEANLAHNLGHVCQRCIDDDGHIDKEHCKRGERELWPRFVQQLVLNLPCHRRRS